MSNPKQKGVKPVPSPDEKAEALRKVEEAMQASNEDNTDSGEVEDFSDLEEELTAIAEKVNPAPKSKPVKKPSRPTYEEWMCQINGQKVDKLKKMRENITITEDQARILNEGVIDGVNNYALMYFLPE